MGDATRRQHNPEGRLRTSLSHLSTATRAIYSRASSAVASQALVRLVRNGDPCVLCGGISNPDGTIFGCKGSEDFRASAENGCPGCILIVRAVDLMARLDLTAGDLSDAVYWETQAWDGVRVNLTDIVTESSMEDYTIWFFDVKEKGHPWPWQPKLIGNRLPKNTYDETMIAKISNWISTCESSHPCKPRSHAVGPLPTRVIDVDCLRVFETHGKEALYMCLSHCWAGHARFESTKSNIAQRTISLSWEAMPKTYQDAITLTRRLGVRYLWIDSLCIVQDDVLDWQRESVKMAIIYSNSYLTIGADLCSGSQHAGQHKDLRPIDGCFSSVASQHAGFTLENLPHPIFSSRRYSVGIRREIDHRPNVLGTRGWVMQERWLSPRYLWCQNNDVLFECEAVVDCLCGQLVSAEVGQKSQVPRNAESTSQLWHTMVEKFTALSLTFEKDCLPAISGIARSLGRDEKSNYLAGLWKDSLVEDLQWANRADFAPRPSPRRAPTWSWASTRGRCVYHSKPPGFYETCRRHVRILDAKTSFADVDPCGRVAGGTIVLSGRLIPAKLLYSHKTSSQRSNTDSLELEPTLGANVGSRKIELDYDLESDDVDSRLREYAVFLLILVSHNIQIDLLPGDGRTKRPIARCFGLLLRHVLKEVPFYERIAYCEIDFNRGWVEYDPEVVWSKDALERDELVSRRSGQQIGPWYEQLEESRINLI